MSLTRSTNSKVTMTKQIGYICKDIHIQYTHMSLTRSTNSKSDDDKANWVRIQIYTYVVYLCKRCIHNMHICVYHICISKHMSLTRSTNSIVMMSKQIGYIFRSSYIRYSYVTFTYIYIYNTHICADTHIYYTHMFICV